MRTFSIALGTFVSADFHPSFAPLADAKTKYAQPPAVHQHADVLPAAVHIPLSQWSQSAGKRFFDCACVITALPLLLPAFFLVALSVRVTSRGPVLFLQKRIGRGGKPFTIFKFRTLNHAQSSEQMRGRRFTCIGRFLRRWKLDELPQLLNVLLGDLSLVGPRPKMREYELGTPQCRPGITGAATIVFAREEELLKHVPELQLRDSYRAVVMPAKHRLDAEYMAQATFFGDLQLLLRTALRCWDFDTLQNLIGEAGFDLHCAKLQLRTHIAERHHPLLPPMNCPTGR